MHSKAVLANYFLLRKERNSMQGAGFEPAYSLRDRILSFACFPCGKHPALFPASATPATKITVLDTEYWCMLICQPQYLIVFSEVFPVTVNAAEKLLCWVLQLAKNQHAQSSSALLGWGHPDLNWSLRLFLVKRALRLSAQSRKDNQATL